VRVKAVDRMARAQKRQFQGPNHVALDDVKGDMAVVAETPETALSGREEMEAAQETIDRAIANSRLRGFSRRYAERFVEFAAQGLGTADIAKRFNTSEANVRSARSRFIHLLVREGVVAASIAKSIADKPQEDRIAPAPTANEPQH
jgi:DNA-directed RNA polymerase specialized sigma24 family protein